MVTGCQPDSIMVMDDNRTPSWLRMTTGLNYRMTTGTPLWLRMTTGLHYGYG